MSRLIDEPVKVHQNNDSMNNCLHLEEASLQSP